MDAILNELRVYSDGYVRWFDESAKAGLEPRNTALYLVVLPGLEICVKR